MTKPPDDNQRNVQASGVDKTASGVRAMFDDIARSYDWLNHLLSGNQDRRWRRRAITQLSPRADELILDVCCGTGDLALECGRQQPRARIIGLDFAFAMLSRARPKAAPQSTLDAFSWINGDALRLPFSDATFDGVMIAFGARNFEDTAAGLREVQRVLKPGGRLIILEFMRPTSPLVQRGFGAFNLLLSPLGRAVSGHPSAYRYLPQSVGGFYSRREFETLLRTCGFVRVRSFDYSLGIATNFLARRA